MAHTMVSLVLSQVLPSKSARKNGATTDATLVLVMRVNGQNYLFPGSSKMN